MSRPYVEHQAAARQLLHDTAREQGRRVWETFSDWVEVAAIVVTNSVPNADHAEREERYHRDIQKYGGNAGYQAFKRLLVHLVEMLEFERRDVLGELYMTLDLGNEHTGQYFTPHDVNRLNADLTITRASLDALITEKGFVTAHEPTVGAGGMLIAISERVRSLGHNPQQALHVTGIDLDITCVHMSILQLALLGIPAVIWHGNTLTQKLQSEWATPAHALGFWGNRLRGEPVIRPASEDATPATEAVQPALFGGAT